MLVKNPESQEGYIHICADSHRYTKQALKDRMPILLHDIKSYTLIEGKNGFELIDIKFCPYCGAEIAADEYKSERGL